MNRTLECALHYISQGWQVMPLHKMINGKCSCGKDCSSPGKHPATNNGAKDATTDETTVRGWFEPDERYNIGVCCGEASALVVLDIDPAHGGEEALAELMAKLRIKEPETLQVITGGDGRHLYFKHPGGDVRNSAGTLGKGLDVRGHHGYVVAPPSNHASGKEYRWKTDPRSTPLAACPKWVIDNNKQSRASQAQQKAQQKAQQGATTEGGRNNLLTSLAGTMRNRGLSHEAILAALQAENTLKCDPPLPSDEVATIAASVAGYEPKDTPDVTKATLNDDLPHTVAKAFMQQSKVAHKYNRFDGWSIWSKGKYQKVEDVKELRLHIRKYLPKCRILKNKRQPDGSYEKYTEKLKKQTSGYVTDIIESLAACQDVHILPGKKAPCSLSGVLNAGYIIAAKNCLIDISRRPHRIYDITDDFYTFNYLDYNYVKDAFAEIWAEFLLDICCNDIELMELLQMWAGYLLLPTLKYQKFMLCVGDGANGKGVFFDTLTAALGTDNVSNLPLGRFDNPYARYGTYGKMVNMSNESAGQLANEAESIIKEYVAGDKVFWEQKYKDAYFDYPTAKLMFATNELPRIKDATDGIWRRMILVPFNGKFEGKKQDASLGKKLRQPEVLAAVLNWMIEGAEMLIKNDGFNQPKVCDLALETYRNESNSARMFAIENLQGDEANYARIPCTWLHQQYQQWCADNGFKPMNNVHFGRAVGQLFPVQRERVTGTFTGTKKRNWCYSGIMCLESSELSEKFGEMF